MNDEIIKSKKEELQNAVDNEKLNEISRCGCIFNLKNNVITLMNKQKIWKKETISFKP